MVNKIALNINRLTKANKKVIDRFKESFGNIKIKRGDTEQQSNLLKNIKIKLKQARESLRTELIQTGWKPKNNRLPAAKWLINQLNIHEKDKEAQSDLMNIEPLEEFNSKYQYYEKVIKAMKGFAIGIKYIGLNKPNKFIEDREIIDPVIYYEDLYPTIKRNLITEMDRLGAISFNLSINIKYKYYGIEQDEEIIIFDLQHFSKTHFLSNESQIDDSFKVAVNELFEIISKVLNNSSMTLDKINFSYLNIHIFSPLKGSSYIEMPTYLLNKKAIINVKNNDEYCFLWAISSALIKVEKHADRTSNYTEKFNELKEQTKSLSFPLKICDIPKFRKLTGINVNVFSWDTKDNKPNIEYICKDIKTIDERSNIINLMLIEEQ